MAKLTGVKTIDMVGGEITKVEYNGELYAKVDGHAEVGDIVTVIRPWATVEKDANYFVLKTSESDINDYVHVGDGIVGYQEDFAAYRKVSTQPTSLESRVETLETKVAALEGSEVGDGEYRKVTDRKPRVGDFVKFTEEYVLRDYDLTSGKFYEINDVDSNGAIEFYDDIKDPRGKSPNEDGLSIYEKVGAVDESTALSVGDYAKITEDSYEYKVGDIVKIISEGSSIFDFRVEYVHVQKVRGSGQTNGFIDRSFATKATDEEVANAKKEQAEAKAKAKEAERWAAIGRKPNEFKKGDIVRVVRIEGGVSNGHKEGAIGEVMFDAAPRSLGSGNPLIKANGQTFANNCELITPVESRFDR